MPITPLPELREKYEKTLDNAITLLNDIQSQTNMTIPMSDSYDLLDSLKILSKKV